MLMNARSAECAPAYPGCDFPELEVPEEFLPFLIAGNPVFIGGPLCPPPGKEGQVRLDGLFWVNGLVADSGIDILVTCDDLCNMRRQAAHDGIRDKDSPEIVRRVMQRLPRGDVLQPGMGKGIIQHFPERGVADRPALAGEPALEQDRRRRSPYAFVAVVDGDERDAPVRLADPLDDG